MEGLEPFRVNLPVGASGPGAAVMQPPSPPMPKTEGRPLVPPVQDQPKEQTAQKGEQLTPDQADDLKWAIKGLNNIANMMNRSIRFQVNNDLGRVVAEVVDSQSGEVVRTIPPKELLDTLKRITDAIGLLIDKKA